MPLLGEEVRGIDSLIEFSKNLIEPYPQKFEAEQKKLKEERMQKS